MAEITPLHPDIALNLALAVVVASNAPLLLLDESLTVIAASTTFCETFDIKPGSVQDFKIYELGNGEWNRPQLQTLLKATARGAADIPAYEMDLVRDGRATRQIVINARKLAYGDDADARLVVTIADVTDARIAEKLKDDLIREKAVLLQEVQHRVANSLQIIASVLLQSARQVQSSETRGHLQDAHHRVMSVASVQRQLTASGLGEVKLRAYLADLCDSIGASMIHDHKQISLEVTTDASVVSANVSISLGLIVTELVINSLKHAFPEHRHGKITVDYRSNGPRWTLLVGDDGIGIGHSPPGAESAPKSGLGTSIVEALARQLEARIDVEDTRPGTLVSVVHPESYSVVPLRAANQPV